MGLAASQARLLSITSRLSDNELRAQLINNQKMRLSADSSKVSENYINALNKTNLVFANYDENDKAQNVPLTFNNLTAFNQYNNQYGLTNTAGNILISESDTEKYNASGHDLETFLKQYGIEYTTSYWDTLQAQLETNESFYSKPDGDGVAEADGTTPAKFTNGGAKIDNTTTDGQYNFFDSNELRHMYEGVDPATGKKDWQSYDETIKTSQYTDFSGYIDTFAIQAAALKQAAAQKNQLLGSYAQAALSAGETFAKINSLTALPTDLTDINNCLKNDILKYYDGVSYDATTMSIDMNVLSGYSASGGNGYIDSSTEDFFGDNNTTKLYSTGYDASALYLKFENTATIPATTDYYARVEDPNGDGTMLYAKINTSGNTNLYQWNGTSMELYEYDETQEDGSTLKITPTTNVTISGSTVQFNVEDTDDTGTTYKQTIKYPTFDSSRFPASGTYGDATSANISTVMTMTELMENVKDVLQQAAANIFADIGKGTSGASLKESAFVNSYTFTDDTGATSTKTFTDEEKKILLSQTVTNTNVDEIMEDICALLFGDAKKNKITNSDDMADFLDIIMSGKLKDFVDGGTIVLNNTTTPVEIKYTDFLNDEIKYCINAYILDTMMDFFGEPVYGYMKGGEGNWQVADEEANWYINLFNKIEKCGYQMLPNGLASSTEWIQFALENGIVIMEQIDSTANWQPITYTSCSDIIEQNDSTAATIAEAEYNKAMRQIEAKDEMFDLELKNIDTEHASLESEYESVKKAMSGNIERTFQMYS